MSVPHAPPDQGPAGGAPGGAGSSSLLQPAGDEGYASEDASDGGFGDSDSEFDSEVVHHFTGFGEDDEDDDIGEAAELTEDNNEQPADGNLTAAPIQLGPQGAGGSARAAAALASAMLAGTNPQPAGSKKKKAPAEPERVWGVLASRNPQTIFPLLAQPESTIRASGTVLPLRDVSWGWTSKVLCGGSSCSSPQTLFHA